jgi:ATP-dependent exoDNAse (exonuclease V) beta subunit
LKLETFRPCEAILASAGSGKTEELALRIIRILLRDPRPDSILAITFTRLAAREMLERIVRLLARAVLDQARYVALCENLACDPAPTRAQLEQVLRGLTDNLHRLHLCTIDSFFGDVARCFAFELGLDLDYTLIEESVEKTLYGEAMRRVYQAMRQPAFLARLQTVYDGIAANNDRRRVTSMLQQTIEGMYGVFLATDKAAWQWGRTVAQPLDEAAWEEVKERCRDLITDKRAAGFFDKLDQEDWPYVFQNGPTKKLLDGGDSYLKVPLDGELTDVLEAMLAHAEACVIQTCQARTENAHAYLAMFHQHCAALKQQRALMSFDDVARAVQRVEEWQADMLYERLDGRIDHLLLDEFQDTSWTQWRVLAPLANEIICDESARRTFFMVGDVKQAIYGFRGGDARLFNDILAWYNQGGPRIVEQPRNVSYRSGANILELVNRVFDEPRGTSEFAEDFKRWRQATQFAPHTPAPTVASPGYAAVRVVDGTELTCRDATIALLTAIAPWQRGVRTALLFRTNDAVNEYVAALRHAGIPALTQGRSRLFENAAVQAVMAVLRWAAAPADTLAEEQVRTSFLANHVPATDVAVWLADLRARLLYTSYSETLHWLCAGAATRVPPADYARLLQLGALAEQYQPQATCDPADFVAVVEAMAPREPQAGEGVICSTIHGAKGLNFDCVILPGLHLTRPNGAGHMLYTRKDAAPRTALEEPCTTCVLAPPPVSVCRGGARLRPLYDAVLGEETFSFCNMMYVALTRAAKALYVVCNAAAGDRDFAAYLLRMLEADPARVGLAFERGDAQWFRHHDLTDAVAATPIAAVPRIVLRGVPTRHRPAVRPSALATVSTAQRAQWFTSEWLQPAQHGTLLHNVLQHIPWRDATVTDAALRALVRRVEPTLADEAIAPVVQELRRLLNAPQIGALFTRPAEPCEVRTELTFAALLPAAADERTRHSALLRGAMDRVVLYPSAAAPQRIDVYDFKTGRVPAGETPDAHAQRYAAQLQAYRTALARGYNVPRDNVRAWAVLTACDAVCQV